MIKVIRGYLPNSTIGELTAGKFKCVTLELPWKDNKQEVSCIPEGVYQYEIKHSVKAKRNVIWILNVKDRESIQVHPGNFTRQILGCCLVGDSIKYMDQDDVLDVTNSGNTFDKLLSILPIKGTIEFTSLAGGK